MRLIDADEILSWMKNHFDVSHYYHPYSKLENYKIPYTEIEDMIERIPTIEAIPMEYIEKFTATKNVRSQTIRIVLEIPEEKALSIDWMVRRNNVYQ